MIFVVFAQRMFFEAFFFLNLRKKGFGWSFLEDKLFLIYNSVLCISFLWIGGDLVCKGRTQFTFWFWEPLRCCWLCSGRISSQWSRWELLSEDTQPSLNRILFRFVQIPEVISKPELSSAVAGLRLNKGVRDFKIRKPSHYNITCYNCKWRRESQDNSQTIMTISWGLLF